MDVTEKRRPMPPGLRARIEEVGRLAILAGCTADEIIALARREVELWMETHEWP